MKAKEIITRLEEHMVKGIEAIDALTNELTDDFTRMHIQAKERNSGSAAFVRAIREYNQKWNSVFAKFKDDPRFLYEGRSFLHENQFAFMTIDILYPTGTEAEKQKQVNLILSPKAISNMDAWRRERLEREGRVVQDQMRRMLFGNLGL